MHHDHLRLAADHGVTHGHGHGDIFVGYGNRFWGRQAQRRGLGEGFDQRRKIGAGIGEEVIYAAVGQQRQIGVRDGAGLDDAIGHLNFPAGLFGWPYISPQALGSQSAVTGNTRTMVRRTKSVRKNGMIPA